MIHVPSRFSTLDAHRFLNVRQDERAARIRWVRDMSWAPGETDALLAGEERMSNCPGIPAANWVPVLCPEADPEMIARICDLHRIAEAMLHLRLYNGPQPGDGVPDLRDWPRIGNFYRRALDHAFDTLGDWSAGIRAWAGNVSMRMASSGIASTGASSAGVTSAIIHRAADLAIIAPHLLFQLGGSRQGIHHQLIVQSARWAYTAYYVPIFSHDPMAATAAWRNALQLIRGIDVPAYREYLIFLQTEAIAYRDPSSRFSP